ncbi:DUF6470 family protein [Amphibacillus indicireducens]|uniref:DUF6470 family protein n=1 Tax=Amphibacillus indicireducens TaxID=1076330 RepID=A0ABP7VQU4_9BACI
MRVPQVRMQSQLAQISIDTQNAHQDIRQPKATQEIEQPSADLSIRTRPGRLTIDQSQAWYDMGLKSAIVSRNDWAREGYQDVMAGIARRVREGTEQMKIENDGNALVAQATRNAHKDQKQINIKFIPSVFSVKTDYQPAQVDIRIEANQPLIRHTTNKPIMTYTRGQVTTEITQEQKLDIDFADLYYRSFGYEMLI